MGLSGDTSPRAAHSGSHRYLEPCDTASAALRAMSFPGHRCSLRFHRKRWNLKQQELAELLAISRSAITKAEAAERLPPVQLLIATELLFGICPRDLFPTLFEQVERDVALRAASLQDRMVSEGSRPATSAFLGHLLTRAAHNQYPVCQQPTLFP